MAKSYYAILGISSNASGREIRSAYRRLAKEFHPDRNPAGGERFRDLQEAYSVLGNPQLRHQYERKRRESIPRPSQSPSAYAEPEPLIPGHRSVDMGEISPVRSFHTFRPSVDEFFDRLWTHFSSLDWPRSGRVQDLTLEVPLTREQAARGGTVRVMMPARAACRTCIGSGAIGPFECARCAGEGAIIADIPISLSFPPGLKDAYAVVVPLERFGIRNLHAKVLFRPTDQDEAVG